MRIVGTHAIGIKGVQASTSDFYPGTSTNIIQMSFAVLCDSSRILTYSFPSHRHSHVSYPKRFSRARIIVLFCFPSASRYFYRRTRIVDVYDIRPITDRKCTQRKQRILRLLEASRTRKRPISPSSSTRVYLSFFFSFYS